MALAALGATGPAVGVACGVPGLEADVGVGVAIAPVGVSPPTKLTERSGWSFSTRTNTIREPPASVKLIERVLLLSVDVWLLCVGLLASPVKKKTSSRFES